MYNKEISQLTLDVYLESERKRKETIDPSEQFEGWEFIQQQGELSPNEIKLRQQFVEEYVKDKDSYKALIRCGFLYAYAQNHHKQLLAEPFVQDLIVAYKHRLESVEDSDANYIDEIVNVYREVMNNPESKGSERVSAAAKLAELKGLNKVQESKVSVDFSGGVLKMPVMVDNTGNMIDVDSFSVLAQKQQAELRQKVLESVVDLEE